MSRLGFKTVVYNGELCLGELEAVPAVPKEKSCYQFPNNEIVIHHFSPPSGRCAPLAVLQTVSSFSVRCKLESSVPIEQPHLINLHSACFYESKTAVILIGDEEIHMVAMPSRQKKFPCFWCWSVPKGLYAASMSMLNPRCLAIVFDLDETLIVANTMKSFEDRIEALRAWIARENDPLRYSGMAAELKRYMDDRALLKMYCENDNVVDNGNAFKAQMEEIPPISDSQNKLVRPVIRLSEKNIVLTRINPEIRDTSVLVRLRPAWEDLRNYLNAKGRKRFEVYVCTMAERDYALEIWRLLDPEAHLIDLKQLPDRVFCVKAGSKKSLSNVFQSGMCHPRMGMVIDDRMKVWEDRDQQRVHVVPPFAPYYAPQAETAHPVPVLCVARNVACNVRGWFFREFDETFSRKIVEISYEDDVGNLPHAPDVSNFMVSEDAGSVPNGNSHVPNAEGMSGAEVEHRINHWDEKKIGDSAPQSINFDANSRAVVSQPLGALLPNPVGQMSSGSLLPSQKPGLLGASFRRDMCSDNDYDMRKRVQTVKFGADVRGQTSSEPPLLPRVPAPVSASSAAQSLGGWLKEEGFNKGNKNDFGFNQDHGPFRHDKHRANQNSYSHSTSCFTSPGLFSATPQTKAEEACIGQQGQKTATSLLGVGIPHNQASSNSRDLQNGAGRTIPYPSSSFISVLQEIGKICSAKIEFRPVMSTSHNVQFTMEVFYTGQKIGVGMGKTRKDAQQQAAENALNCLAEGYRQYMMPSAGGEDKDPDKHSLRNENGFLWDDVHSGKNEVLREDGLATESTPEVGFSGSVYS